MVVETKKQTAVSLTGVSLPRFATNYNDRLFVFDQKNGVSVFSGNKKTNVIPFDPDWGTIKDMRVFNGNLYLLDIINDEVYKYFPIGDGFAEKASYFKQGSGISLATAKEVVIDFSLYVRSAQSVVPFTSGVRQKNMFDTSLPYSSITSMSKNEKTKNFYFLDSSKARIIIVDNKGTIQKSLFNEKLRKATALVAPNDSLVLFLTDNVVYRLIF